ncbi:DUF1772 domain-containing protein [Ktedonosporobacter rubrisoli]|uniref:DUF1772 domain-containing protein n=1 Tax=Ktedonosporobacter rubrisoli TaxID=2509675 RepID=A0A4P6JQZ5_KTERU|nr:anthrone oxygenase family protein [Ktedonosporobacter rubrisoli]QBD77592.1 DUF1772 domain-containing protein [Ktedonosporobacter rubrisoli]
MEIVDIVLVGGGTLAGLCAGLLYAFSVAIIPALHVLKGSEHIAAMQAINVKILNPVFFLSFFGPAILLPLAAILAWGRPQFALLIVAALLYIVGVIGVTSAGNIPLNDKLAKLEAHQLPEAEADRARKEYQGQGAAWMRFHTIRTLAATLTTVLVFIACLFK